jgi:hypothetical protein
MVWILLLITSVLPPATTPLDQWKGFTFLSLLAAAGSLAALIYEIIKWNNSKEG